MFETGHRRQMRAEKTAKMRPYEVLSPAAKRPRSPATSKHAFRPGSQTATTAANGKCGADGASERVRRM